MLDKGVQLPFNVLQEAQNTDIWDQCFKKYSLLPEGGVALRGTCLAHTGEGAVLIAVITFNFMTCTVQGRKEVTLPRTEHDQ